MNIVIIDDEQLAIDVLQIMIRNIRTLPLEVKGAFTKIQDARLLLEKEQIDVVLLDIEMGDVHGLQVARELLSIQPSLQIIFVTAHMQFAVDAFEIEATDYLLKPVHEKRLTKALEKVQGKLATQPFKQLADEGVLTASAFGSFQLFERDGTLLKWRTKKAKELFVYMWLHQEKPILNSVLIEILWPNIEDEKGAANLYTTVYQLRKLLKQVGIDHPIELVNNQYKLNVRVRSDVDEVMQLLEKGTLTNQEVQHLLNIYMKGIF